MGLLANQATVASDYGHALDHMLQAGVEVHAVFGPQHGLYGHTQDNMIEWEGGHRDARTGVLTHSLYGERRKPTPAMLAGLDVLVADLPDIGSRYYTFVWTLLLTLEAAAEQGLPVVVLDRPNPIGRAVEGTMLQREFASFVGLHSVPTRHGLTLGELARLLKRERVPNVDLTVIEADGYDPDAYGDEIPGAPWAMPSPNMPTVGTAVVYPGGCLLEATNMSEGRGTTRPFETFGAPWLDSWRYADALNGYGLPGSLFRPLPFQPTFNKHAGKLCGGVFLHVTDRRAFRPVITYVAAMREAARQGGFVEFKGSAGETFSTASPEVDAPGFAWKLPPYEYETVKLPIDILAGNDWLRPAILGDEPLARIEERMAAELAGWPR